jgi:hypothetical protein
VRRRVNQNNRNDGEELTRTIEMREEKLTRIIEMREEKS